jgi:TctA family transporter
MLALVGLATVSIVSRGSPLLGMLSAIIGLMLAAVGTATTVIQYRYTFGVLALQDGLSLVVIALGLFAVPETIQLLLDDRAVSETGTAEKGGLLRGIKDTFKNWGLVVRSAMIGASLGMLPGVGGSIIDWVTWGLASRSKKNERPFGEGEIRGVIAPESANNAKEGGTLIPTFLFGIPGSGTTAVLLGGLTLMGVQTGPRMVQGEGLVIIISVVFALMIANVLATTISLGITKPMARITLVKSKVLAPFLMIVVTLASFQDGQGFMGNIYLFLGMGFIGWVMLALRIPRPPLLIGFVLGPSVERYLWISMSRYGLDWLLPPGVVILAVIIVGLLFAGLRQSTDSTVKIK